MVTRCDSCGQVFTVKYLHKKYTKGIEEHYFKCKHCNYRYSFFWTNPKIRQLDRERKEILQGDYPIVVEQIAKMQEEINELSEALRNVMIAKLNLNDYKNIKKGDDI